MESRRLSTVAASRCIYVLYIHIKPPLSSIRIRDPIFFRIYYRARLYKRSNRPLFLVDRTSLNLYGYRYIYTYIYTYIPKLSGPFILFWCIN